MKTRFLILSSLVVVLGCDKIERDWSKCNTVQDCHPGHSCRNARCEPNDAGLDTAPTGDGATPPDAAGDGPHALEADSDRADAPGEAPVDTPLDGLVIDAPVDGSPDVVDAPAVDGPRTCGDDQDCPADLPLCLNSRCVQCKDKNDCTQGDGGVDDNDGGSDGGATRAGFCNLKTNMCVGCLSHADCRDPRMPVCGTDQTCVACGAVKAPEDGCSTRNPALPACHALTGMCVQCTRTSDCLAKTGDAGAGDAGRDGGTAGSVCSANNTCVECNGPADCTDPFRAFCVSNACVGCGIPGTDACTGSKPLCATSGSKAGQCVECTSNAQCLAATSPICESNQCRACKKDSECSANAGICALDGSCPKTSLVVYAQASSQCTSSNRGQGTVDFPYCDLDSAIATASANNSVVRIIGTVASSAALAIAQTKKPLLITGASASTAIINPPPGSSGPVLSITGGDVTLRDLTITGGKAAGVNASAGAVHVNRCTVLNNAGTGIAVGNGVAFDITSTVVAGNGGTTSAGVSLGSYTGTGPHRFEFNTVVNNGYGGVVCAAGQPLTGILANNNGMLNVSANCITDPSSSTAAPLFGSNFHLTASSPCVNAGGSSCSADDIDGEARPKGSACDCGADEF